MTSSSTASTYTVSSTSQYSAETLLLAILERPSTSVFQSVDVVMETPDLEVILPSKDPTVATRPFVHLCDPTAVTLPLHSTPLEPPSSRAFQFVLGRNTFHRLLAILQAHLFCHYSFHSPIQAVRKFTVLLNYRKFSKNPGTPLKIDGKNKTVFCQRKRIIIKIPYSNFSGAESGQRDLRE